MNLNYLNALSKVNKDVYFKLYPTEQYLVEKLPTIKEFIKKLKIFFWLKVKKISDI